MASGYITMSRKETIRLEQIISIETGKISHSEASKLLGLSRRQVIRVRKRYRLQGALGLLSKRRGNPSNNRVSENTRSKILELIGSTYTDFGPTFLREKLIENQIATDIVILPGIAFTFLKAIGKPIGKSLFKAKYLEKVKNCYITHILF